MSFKQKYLKDDNSTYFIAEIGINHNGLLDLAKKMIDFSKDAGANAVKFQKRNVGSLVLPGVTIEEPTGYLSKHETDFPSEEKAFGTWTYPDVRLEFSESDFLDIWEYTNSINLDFIVSPWDENSVDLLAENNAKVIKLASIDATNYQFCKYIAKKKIPTIISTGMSTYNQLDITFKIFNDYECPVMFLHCTSSYPCPYEDKNLNCIPVMHKMYGIDIGFSGHGEGIEGSLAAITLGANVVEKHVTLSRKMSGPDQLASLEFEEFEQLVNKSNNILKALGNGDKSFKDSEKTLHGVLSKRIVTTCDIEKGQEINDNMITTYVTKSDVGLYPNQYFQAIGSKTTRKLNTNHILLVSDFEK